MGTARARRVPRFRRQVLAREAEGREPRIARRRPEARRMSAKPFQFLEVPPLLAQALSLELRSSSWSEIHGAFAADEAATQASRCIDCGNPWCEWKCPLHNRIPNWLALVREGRLFDAATLVHETNPLPEVCGRVCP